jgi:cytochrome bd-type quinol oxidase subunit 2
MFNPSAHRFLLLWLALPTFWGAAWFAALYREKRPSPKESHREDFQFIIGATLTLLGLIVAFTFSMAVSRYDQRKNYEEEEANAIGTEYVRANLLPSADAAKVRALLKSYLAQRILYYTVDDEQQLRPINDQTARLQNDLWAAVAAPAAAQPTAVNALILAGMNDVLNSQGYTQAAFWNRIPIAAWALMIVIAIFCNMLVGFGVRSRNAFLLLILPIILSVSFLLIADIDNPRRGVIEVLPQNLESLAESLRGQ